MSVSGTAARIGAEPGAPTGWPLRLIRPDIACMMKS